MSLPSRPTIQPRVQFENIYASLSPEDKALFARQTMQNKTNRIFNNIDPRKMFDTIVVKDLAAKFRTIIETFYSMTTLKVEERAGRGVIVAGSSSDQATLLRCEKIASEFFADIIKMAFENLLDRGQPKSFIVELLTKKAFLDVFFPIIQALHKPSATVKEKGNKKKEGDLSSIADITSSFVMPHSITPIDLQETANVVLSYIEALSGHIRLQVYDSKIMSNEKFGLLAFFEKEQHVKAVGGEAAASIQVMIQRQRTSISPTSTSSSSSPLSIDPFSPRSPNSEELSLIISPDSSDAASSPSPLMVALTPPLPSLPGLNFSDLLLNNSPTISSTQRRSSKTFNFPPTPPTTPPPLNPTGTTTVKSRGFSGGAMLISPPASPVPGTGAASSTKKAEHKKSLSGSFSLGGSSPTTTAKPVLFPGHASSKVLAPISPEVNQISNPELAAFYVLK